MKKTSVTLMDTIKEFNDAQPGSVERMKKFCEISRFKIRTEEEITAMADIMMSLLPKNDETGKELNRRLKVILKRKSSQKSFPTEVFLVAGELGTRDYGVDDIVIMGCAPDGTEDVSLGREGIEKKYGGNPWFAASEILINNQVRGLLKKRVKELMGYDDSWSASFQRYES